MHATAVKNAYKRLPSLFDQKRNCCALAHAHRVALLVDGEAYFRAFAEAAERACHSILVVAWDFNSNACLRFDCDPAGEPPTRLGDFLNWLARHRRDLEIRILDWDYPMLYGTDREFPPIYGLGWTPHRRVHVKYDNTHPVGGCHHQKIVVIDDAIAFVGGLDLTDRRWDTPAHHPAEAHRIHEGSPYPPFHDLMVAVDGEAARVLADIARRRWLAATGEVLTPVTAAGDPWPPRLQVAVNDVAVAVARTLPAIPGRTGVREVEQLYLDMIAAARHSIYIENQYFTAYRIGEALAARLGEAEGPEVILVTREMSHGWLEENTMHVLRTRLIRQMREADRHGRFHIYYPHIDGLAENTCIDVHSKLMIVDDEILRVGSANLANRSMGMDSECDVAIEARGDARIGAVIRDFRNGLLSEHLNVPVERVEAAIRHSGDLHGAIEDLRGEGRSLKPLGEIPEWPSAVIELAQVADPENPVSLDELVDELTPDISAPHTISLGKKLIVLAAVLLGFTALWRYTPLAAFLSPDRIIAWSHAIAAYPWAPLVIILAYLPASVVMFPRPLITFAAVIAFGPFPGVVYAFIGVMLAAWGSYEVGRRLPRDTVRNLAGEHLNSVTDTLRHRGLLAVTALRLVPLMPFAVLGLVAGAIRIKWWHFMTGSAIGILPGTLVATVFGHQMEAALQDPAEISYGAIAGILAVVAILTLMVRKWLRKQARHGSRAGGGHG